MTTIPSRLAQVARASSSPEEAKKRVIDLYRAWVRAAPEIVTLYALPVTSTHVRQSIRHNFETHRHVTDPRAIDVLIHKSRQDLQECLNCWKQTDHVMGILLLKEDEGAQKKTFLQKFLEGRDEDAVRPAASGVV